MAPHVLPATTYAIHLRRTFFGVHCPARLLLHDPMQLRQRADALTPLQGTTVFLFQSPEEANFFAQMLYTHRRLAGAWPSRELMIDETSEKPVAYEPWQWAKEIMLTAPDMLHSDATETHGLEVHACDTRQLQDLAASAHIQFALIQLNSMDPFQPPQGYSVTPWIVEARDPKLYLEKTLLL